MGVALLLRCGDHPAGREVLRPVLLAVLYQREDEGDPESWPKPPELPATVVRWTRGFGTLALLPVPASGATPPPQGQAHPGRGSLVEQVIRKMLDEAS